MAQVPIVRVGNVLLATVQEELSDRDALDLQVKLGDALERTGARGVLIDMSVVETVDSFLGRLLNETALGARLLGAQTVVVGIQPAVAITLVELGLELKGVRGAVDQSRIATAVSELTRNVVRYATDGRGDVLIRPYPRTERGTGLEIVVSDEGPGIADVELAMREGFTSGPGMGMGLPGTKRLMDEMEIESELGRGTTVTIRKWRR